jgi:hypothetical protein
MFRVCATGGSGAFPALKALIGHGTKCNFIVKNFQPAGFSRQSNEIQGLSM